MSAAFDRPGLDRAVAEAIAGAIRAGQGQLATKADLDALAQALRGEMGEIRTELRWVKTIGGAIVALLVALVLLAGRIAFAVMAVT